MMCSPEYYIEQLKNDEYLELIKKRDRLIRFIKKYEAKEIAGDRTGEEWDIDPQPDVCYQMYLEYLGALCTFMREKYNREYVSGKRKLQDDAAKSKVGKKRR